eukprot:CAMPEP_0114663184 /NCGR_PEP_ID=MMETSP0191-20121206/26421_1 /TAXON_ID=126664 /ORGANISM="Sorites sp." /LENGTH=193 /DNA_ID=CAMNT_0001901807 /DNA_START=2134 /DNA_END=2712 /DNA_ORIENTATION=-
MLTQATHAIRDAIDAERVSIWYEDGQGGLECLNIGYDSSINDNNDINDDNKNEEETNNELFGAIARYCAEDQMIVNLPNVYDDEDLLNEISDFMSLDKFSREYENIQRKYASMISVPILSNEKVVGVIQAIYKNGAHMFSDVDEQIVISVSMEVAHTIARNISDLMLQSYVASNNDTDIPLDVLDYYYIPGVK